MKDNKRLADQLLDSALASRQHAEPRAGLEGRILERVRTVASERTFSRSRWRFRGAAIAAAAAMALLAVIYLGNQTRHPAVQSPPAGNSIHIPSPSIDLSARAETARNPGSSTTLLKKQRPAFHGRKASRPVAAKDWPSQFPTPAPLTKEEKLLIEYVRNTPPQVLAEPVFKKAAIQPIEIKPLKIPPVKIRPLESMSTREETE